MKLKISDIFYVKTGVRITEEEVYYHRGNIPCVTAQTTNQGITWYADEEWLKTFSKNKDSVIVNEPCITWSKDGYAGKLFYRNYPFFPNDHCGVLIPKVEYKNKINLKWFVYTHESLIMNNVSQSNTQPMLYNEAMSNIEINLPLTKNGEIDVELQNAIVEKYEKINSYKVILKDTLAKIDNVLQCKVITDKKYLIVSVGDCFTLSRGDVISEEDIYNNFDVDGIPIYSSQTANDGCMGKVKEEFYLKSNKRGGENSLTWTTDGANAGKVFYRNNKYLYTNVCGKLSLKKEYVGKINIKFVSILLNIETQFHTNAKESNPKLMSNQMEAIKIKLPIYKYGEIDIDMQNEIVKIYDKIEMYKREINKIIKKINIYIN